MSRAREWLVIGLVAAAAAIAGYVWNAYRLAPEPASSRDAAKLTVASFADLRGNTRKLDEWRGKVLVVNFWATWCAPCREEIPMFVRLQDKYGAQGLQFVGVAVDQPEKVGPYADELKMNFPVLIGSLDAIELTRSLGNRAGVLPFTVVLSRDGVIRATQIGAAKETKLEALLSSLLF